MIKSPKKCGEGTCAHAAFPHRIVIVPERESRVRDARTKKVWIKTYPQHNFVICNLCDHLVTRIHTVCGCDCHTTLIESA